MTQTKEQKTTAAVKAPHRQFEGVVLNISGQKTIRVSVKTRKMHPKYHKQYWQSRAFLVHDEAQVARPGETVRFQECRPLSKTKRWRLISK